MGAAPRVSVLVPAYNNARFIRETVESILAQTFTDFELIISDHASDDGTWEIIQGYGSDPRVELHRISSGGGAPRNWNSVTERASGELLKLVCGDDVLAPEALARQVEAYDRASAGVSVVASPRAIVDAQGQTIVRSRGLAGMEGRVPGRAAIRRTVRSGTNVLGEPCCVLVNRAVLQAIGGWDGRHGYFIDFSTYVALLAHGDLIAVPDTLASFRVSADQWSVRLAADQARQAREVFRTVHEALPDVVSTADARIGTVRAQVLAAARRVLYFRLSRRLTR